MLTVRSRRRSTAEIMVDVRDEEAEPGPDHDGAP
jgi:hypothetical protein